MALFLRNSLNLDNLNTDTTFPSAQVPDATTPATGNLGSGTLPQDIIASFNGSAFSGTVNAFNSAGVPTQLKYNVSVLGVPFTNADNPELSGGLSGFGYNTAYDEAVSRVLGYAIPRGGNSIELSPNQKTTLGGSPLTTVDLYDQRINNELELQSGIRGSIGPTQDVAAGVSAALGLITNTTYGALKYGAATTQLGGGSFPTSITTNNLPTAGGGMNLEKLKGTTGIANVATLTDLKVFGTAAFPADFIIASDGPRASNEPQTVPVFNLQSTLAQVVNENYKSPFSDAQIQAILTNEGNSSTIYERLLSLEGTVKNANAFLSAHLATANQFEEINAAPRQSITQSQVYHNGPDAGYSNVSQHYVNAATAYTSSNHAQSVIMPPSNHISIGSSVSNISKKYSL